MIPVEGSAAVKGITNVWVNEDCRTMLPLVFQVALVAGEF